MFYRLWGRSYNFKCLREFSNSCIQLLYPSTISYPKCKYDQIDNINNVFIDTSGDNVMYLLVDLPKPPKFDDPSLESLGDCQGFEALQLCLMIMWSCHNPDGLPERDWI